MLRPAVNGQCEAPEGAGSYELTAECSGISYPTGPCPENPHDIQVVFPSSNDMEYILTFDVVLRQLLLYGPDVGVGFCRSVKNNGCSEETFHAGHCPGDSDVQGCVDDNAPSPSPPQQNAPAPANPCTAAGYDKLMFQDSMATFLAVKKVKNPGCFDWSNDGCSCSPDDFGEFNFLNSCQRHDFGYRKGKKQG